MIDEKTRIAVVVAKLVKDLSDAYPDVGMGPMPATILDRALEHLGWDREDIHWDAALKEIFRLWISR